MSHLREHVFTIAVQPKAPREGLLNLSSNELIHPTVSRLLEDIAIPPQQIQCYPLFHSLLEDLAGYHRCSRDEVLVSAGSDDGIRLVIEALVSTHGRLILQSPNYERWLQHAPIHAVKIVPVGFGSRTADAFALDHVLEAVASQPPSVLAISNPNGPIGFTFTPSEVNAIASACERHGHFMIIDACYAAFSGIDPGSLRPPGAHVIVLHSFSKSFGIAGVRIASMLGTARTISYLARWRPQNPVSGVAVGVLRELLRKRDILTEIHRDIIACREWFAQAVCSLRPWIALPSGGNFINFRTRHPEEAERVTQRLYKRSIRIRNTNDVEGLRASVRFTIADRITMERVFGVLAESDDA